AQKEPKRGSERKSSFSEDSHPISDLSSPVKKDVRSSASDDGCEPEHGVVHVSRCVDHLHPHPLLLMAPRSLRLPLLPWHRVDHRPPRPFHHCQIRICADHDRLRLGHGTPFGDDQGIYNRLTWWEQIDNGKQLTRNRKFLTVVPVVLYLIASHTTDYQHPMLFLNTLAVFVMVVAKFPHMHKVRIFGINADQ
ncbi:unnamed protein product, partial [Thlaspi arvense]